MLVTFLALLAGHLAGDFLCLPAWGDLPTQALAERRGPTRLALLMLHVMAVVVLTALALGRWDPEIVRWTAATHLAMDLVKRYVLPDNLRAFLLDQAVHVGVAAALAARYPEAAEQGWWLQAHGPEFAAWYFTGLSLIAGVTLCVPAGGVLVERSVRPFLAEIAYDDIKGLSNGGKVIGYLERALVLLLVLMDQITGIGFLVAAKSILRFGEIKEASHRKVAEYIIIGTFLSFGWALLTAALARQAILYGWGRL
jgi:hypothetical protein